MPKTKKLDSTFKPDWEYLGRSLDNYKSLHRAVAKDKGVEKEFMEAKTLTAARKICFGYKKGQSK